MLGLKILLLFLSYKTGEVYKTGMFISTAVAAGMVGILLRYVNCKSIKNMYHTVRDKL